jgi:hypothetical protein
MIFAAALVEKLRRRTSRETTSGEGFEKHAQGLNNNFDLQSRCGRFTSKLSTRADVFFRRTRASYMHVF